MSELSNWGSKGHLTGLGRRGACGRAQSLLLHPILGSSWGAWRSLELRSRDQRLSKQPPAARSPSWEGKGTLLGLGESQACEEASLWVFATAGMEGQAQAREAGVPGGPAASQGPA